MVELTFVHLKIHPYTYNN